MSDQTLAGAWLNQVLNGDATLLALVPGGFWPRQAPASVSVPYGIWQSMAQGYENGATAAIYMMGMGLWSIYIIDEGNDDAPYIPAINRINTLVRQTTPLHEAEGILIGAYSIGCPPTTVRPINGKDFIHIGVGMYHIDSQDATLATVP